MHIIARFPSAHVLSMLMRDVYLGFMCQGLPDLLNALLGPRRATHAAHREQELVLSTVDHGIRRGRGLRHDDVNVLTDLSAEGVEREIVDIDTEGVFDFATDKAVGRVSFRSEERGVNSRIAYAMPRMM